LAYFNYYGERSFPYFLASANRYGLVMMVFFGKFFCFKGNLSRKLLRKVGGTVNSVEN